MILCYYGCSKEAKYKPHKGTPHWCCESHWSRCPKNIKINSDSKKGLQPWNKNIKQTKEAKKEQSNSMKKKWKDLDFRKKQKDSRQSKEYINKMQNIRIGFENPMYGRKLSLEHKNILRLDIKTIKEKYPTFAKEEEMRYNPDKLPEKEIQVHCKYSECKNSKENNGWFTPIGGQLDQRRRELEHDDGCFFYCSEECKQSCCLYNVHSDPNKLEGFKKYHEKVWKETNKSLREFSNKIKNINFRGKKYGYDLDHKYTVYDGFINNVDPKIIGHYKNLEILTTTQNRIKKEKSSITLKELLRDVKGC